MGLDGVELVMALEEEFGIEISDADAAYMMTPRHVIDHVARLVHSDQRRCTSRAGFYQFRRACISALGISRDRIRPDTKLSTLLPPADIPYAWAQIGQAMDMPEHYWPSLVYPAKIEKLRTTVFWLVIALLTVFAGALFGWIAALLLFIVSLRLAFWIDAKMEVRFGDQRVLLPAKLITVTDLIDELIPQEWVKAQGMINHWDRERIANKVKEIVIDQLGINEEQYHEDARFIEDFGVG